MPRRVLIVGSTHPHKGRTGTVVGTGIHLGASEMVQVDLDTPGIGGATSCYAEPQDLIPVASDYRSEAA